MAFGEVRVRYDPGSIGRLKKALTDFKREPEIQDAFEQWTAYYRAFLRKRFVLFSRGGGNWAPLAFSTLNQRRKGKPKRGAKKPKPIKATKPRKPPKPTKAKKARKRPPTVAQLQKQLERERKAFWARAERERKRDAKKFLQNERREQRKHASAAKGRQRVAASILRDTGAMFAAFQPVIADITGIGPRQKLGMVVLFGGKGSRHGITLDRLMEIHHLGLGRHLPARELIVPADLPTAERMAKRMEQAFQKVLDKHTG